METCLVTAVPVGDGHPTSQPDLVRDPQGDPTDVAGGDGYPASWLDSRADAQGDGMDVGTGRAFEASGMDPALELTWHARGPQGAKYKAEIGKSSQQSSEVLKEILKDLDKSAHGVDGKRNTNATDPKDFRNSCIEGVVAILGSVLFGMVLCCAICLWRRQKRKQ
ncbi:uncharacterized protein LJ206_001838 isoform 1-T1 [Theristicus caerulescens]